MMPSVERIKASDKPEEFDLWLNSLLEGELRYEVVINDGYINHVVVDEVNNGDWSEIDFGRVVGTKMVSYKKRVYKPAIVNGKFTENYNVQEGKEKNRYTKAY